MRQLLHTVPLAVTLVAGGASSHAQNPVTGAGGGAQAPSGLSPQVGRPYFLAGTVVLEDGAPPTEPVPIVRSCGGADVPLGFTDARGRFSFGAGTHSTARIDVQNQVGADPLASGYADLMGCELRAVATGFSSDVISLGSRRLLESPDVGTIVLRRLAGVRGSAFSVTTLRAKKGARKAFENGRELGRKKRYDDAAREYEKAVQAAPSFATAWFELGLVRQVQGRIEEAKKAYRESVTADPEFVKPYRQLAVISFEEKDWPGVLKVTERLLWLDPVSYADAHSYDAVARLYTGDLEKAEMSAREASRLDPDYKLPRSRYVLAAVLIEKKDYAGAAAALREYIAHASSGPELHEARLMLSQLDARLPSPAPPAPREPRGADEGADIVAWSGGARGCRNVARQAVAAPFTRSPEPVLTESNAARYHGEREDA